MQTTTVHTEEVPDAVEQSTVGVSVLDPSTMIMYTIDDVVFL